jgi:hypothetical protein
MLGTLLKQVEVLQFRSCLGTPCLFRRDCSGKLTPDEDLTLLGQSNQKLLLFSINELLNAQVLPSACVQELGRERDYLGGRDLKH